MFCLLVEYREYCVWAKAHGYKPERYRDFLNAYLEASNPEGFWRDDERVDFS